MSIQSINARNQFRGKIKEIILGPVVSDPPVKWFQVRVRPGRRRPAGPRFSFDQSVA